MRHRQDRNRPHREISATAGPESGWLWGKHAVKAALANPARRLRRLLITPAALSEFQEVLAERNLKAQTADSETVAKALPRDAVHQGVALLADPLPELDLKDALE